MTLRLITQAKLRGTDRWGSGAFGASRGSRTHNGLDYAACPGDLCLPVKPGTVTKVGYPYSDNLSFRYVEVTDEDSYRARYFYIDPAVGLGEEVGTDTPLGTVQSLNKRYEGITDHVHLEVIAPVGNFIDPEEYI